MYGVGLRRQDAIKLAARVDTELREDFAQVVLDCVCADGHGATPSSGYSVGKGGLHALTHNLAIELAPYNIRVNAVAPAVVATPIYERFVTQDKLEETLHSFDSFHPLGRTGTARDLANTITFLLSPATSWVGSALSGRSSSLDGESDGLLT